jgi:hypothetical protein
MTALDFPSSPSDGQVYQSYFYDATKGVWRRSPELETLDLDNLSDVTLSTPANGQVLQYNGSEWIDGININPSSPVTDQTLIYNGSAWVNTSSPNFPGIVTAANYNIGVTDSTDPGTFDFDFSSDTGLYNISIDSNTTFTGSNYTAGSLKTARVANGATLRTLTFPAGWKFVNEAPADIDVNKVAVLSITSFGATEGECVAAWAVEA